MKSEIFSSRSKGLSGNQLKLIAIILMFIDHMGVMLWNVLESLSRSPTAGLAAPLLSDAPFVNAYYISRLIGRVAFPLFCFELSEGFFHTSNRKRYLMRLFIFALVSEIPFDLLITLEPFSLQYQNVFFELVLGLLCIWSLDTVRIRYLSSPALPFMCGTIITAFCVISEVIGADYGMSGILAICAFYLLRDRRLLAFFAGFVCLILIEASFEIAAIFSGPLIMLYNGERGKSYGGRYFFYAFYPVHLLLLYIIYSVIVA